MQTNRQNLYLGPIWGSYYDIHKLRGTIGFGSWGLGVGASEALLGCDMA